MTKNVCIKLVDHKLIKSCISSPKIPKAPSGTEENVPSKLHMLWYKSNVVSKPRAQS